MPGNAAYTGSIKVSPSTMINGINSIDSASKLNTENTTAFESDGDEEFTATLKGGTLKLSGFRLPDDTGQNALETAHDNRTKVTLIFQASEGAALHTAQFFVTDFGDKADVAGVHGLEVSLLRSGPVTKTPAS